jgi:hypothetical protein
MALFGPFVQEGSSLILQASPVLDAIVLVQRRLPMV